MTTVRLLFAIIIFASCIDLGLSASWQNQTCLTLNCTIDQSYLDIAVLIDVSDAVSNEYFAAVSTVNCVIFG